MGGITINASVPQNQQTEIITYDQGKGSSKKGTGNPAILEKFSGKKPNNKQEDGGKGLGQKKFSDEVGTTLSGKKQPDLHYTFKKGGKEEGPSTKSVVSTDTNKDPVQVLSKIIVDALTPDHIKYAKRGSLKAQQKLYENVFHITGPFQHISTTGSSKRILKIYIGNDFEAAKIIKSLSLLDQLDYDTYGIDETILIQDSPKAQKKLNFVNKMLKINTGNTKKDKISRGKIREFFGKEFNTSLTNDTIDTDGEDPIDTHHSLIIDGEGPIDTHDFTFREDFIKKNDFYGISLIDERTKELEEEQNFLSSLEEFEDELGEIYFGGEEFGEELKAVLKELILEELQYRLNERSKETSKELIVNQLNNSES